MGANRAHITVRKAVEMAANAGVLTTRQTIRNWCRRYPDLGKKVGGQWFVDSERLQKTLTGEALVARVK